MAFGTKLGEATSTLLTTGRNRGAFYVPLSPPSDDMRDLNRLRNLQLVQNEEVREVTRKVILHGAGHGI